MLVLEGLVGFTEVFNFCFFSITGQGIDLDYHDIEWFALEKFGKLSSGHRTGKGQFSFQSERKVMPKNA